MPAGARASASGDPYAADPAATASTLNYALGSRHIKSWMTGAPNAASAGPSRPLSNPAPVPVRERGRPRKHPLPDASSLQHATEVARFQNAPSADRLLSSNSTSPQLANVITHHDKTASLGQADITVLPSPTPSSEEVVLGGEVHNTAIEPRQTNNASSLQSIDAFDLSRAPVTDSSVGPPVVSPKRRPGQHQIPADKRLRVDIASVPQPAPPMPTPSSAFDLPPLPEFLNHPTAQPLPDQGPSWHPSLEQSPDQQLPSPQIEWTPQQHNHTHNLHNDSLPISDQSRRDHRVQDLSYQSPPVRQTQIGPPPPLHTQHFDVLPNAPQAAQPHNGLASQREPSYSSDDWYSVDNCMQMLDVFKMTDVARSRKDHLRLQVLQEAVKMHDWAYLTLHQNYCVMTSSTHSLARNLQSRPNLNAAFSLMQDILDDNRQLAPPVLHFFCQFPFSVDYLRSKWPVRYQNAEREFMAFVDYSAKTAMLRQRCERRRVPPSPREMANCAITSFTFQRLLFRSIIRSLWAKYPRVPEQGAFEEQTLQAFNMALIVYDQRRSLGHLVGRQQAEEELQSWVSGFTQIVQSFELLLQRKGFQRVNQASPHLSQQQQQQQQQPQLRPQSLSRSQAYDQPYSPLYNNYNTEDTSMSHRRRQHPPPAARSRTSSQAQPLPRPRQGSTALLPRPGVLQPLQRVPIPSRFGLHQAHLRSPVLQAFDRSSPLYYFWRDFIVKPTRMMNPNNASERLTFTMNKQRLDRLAKALPAAPGSADIRAAGETDQMVRLRCVKWTSAEEPSHSAWAIAENSWIPHSYFTFNTTPLQLRKKIHHGKDLAVDLTGLVREGVNSLEISVMTDASDTTHRKYLVAVEYLGIMTQASIKQLCYENRVPADKTLDDIKRKLTPTATDDDDVVLVESTLTINLRDPFSASAICDTPVRSTACLHNECFDLDTFLSTRPRKGDVSTPDAWRCPICKADARPNVLVVDDFLIEVRQALESKGLLETRAIIVDSNGKWKVKPEERDPKGVQDRDTPDPTPAARSHHAPVHEVIDLSD